MHEVSQRACHLRICTYMCVLSPRVFACVYLLCLVFVCNFTFVRLLIFPTAILR